MRVGERLLELDQLGVGEGGAIAALLAARIMIHARDLLLGCAAVVLRKVAPMMELVVRIDVIHWRWNYDLRW